MIGVVSGAAVLVAGVAFAATRPTKRATPSQTEAIQSALKQLGQDAKADEVAFVAYLLVYPNGPIPPTGTYVDRWEELAKKAQAALGDSGPVPAPPDPTDHDDNSSELVMAWLDGLTAEQQEQARAAVGKELWDPVVAYATVNNDLGTTTALQNVKREIEYLAAEKRFAAAQLYYNLDEALGSAKLQEFMSVLEATVGAPTIDAS